MTIRAKNLFTISVSSQTATDSSAPTTSLPMKDCASLSEHPKMYSQSNIPKGIDIWQSDGCSGFFGKQDDGFKPSAIARLMSSAPVLCCHLRVSANPSRLKLRLYVPVKAHTKSLYMPRPPEPRPIHTSPSHMLSSSFQVPTPQAFLPAPHSALLHPNLSWGSLGIIAST